MSQRRTLILVAAIAIGALASFLVWNYVSGVEDEANKDAELVSVWVVEAPIEAGTHGVDAVAFIRQDEIPRKYLPENAIAGPDDLSGKVALSSLVPNQIVVNDLFIPASDPRAQQSFAKLLTQIKGTDMVSATIQVSESNAAAGLIEPGDFVNVLVTPAAVEVNPDTAGPEGVATANPLARQARYLYQKVQVLAVGQTAVPAAGSTDEADEAAATTTNRGLITLIVPAKGAQYLASLQPDQIFLSLVALDYKPEVQTPINPDQPLPGENPEILTPYGPEGSIATEAD